MSRRLGYGYAFLVFLFFVNLASIKCKLIPTKYTTPRKITFNSYCFVVCFTPVNLEVHNSEIRTVWIDGIGRE